MMSAPWTALVLSVLRRNLSSLSQQERKDSGGCITLCHVLVSTTTDVYDAPRLLKGGGGILASLCLSVCLCVCVSVQALFS